MATMPEFMQRRLARRTGSDITRLAQNFTMQTGALADQYQSEFAKYQQMVSAKMAPYQAALKEYQTKVEPAYQRELAAYNEKLDAYQKQLADIAADPVTERVERQVVGRTWYGKKKYGNVTYYDPKPIPEFGTPRIVRTLIRPELEILGRRIPAKYKEETVYDPIEAPKAPDIPVAPKIEEFDQSQFDEKAKQIKTEFNREIGERKAARLGAVQRRQRTLLGGVKT